jgi:hypothetical protein
MASPDQLPRSTIQPREQDQPFVVMQEIAARLDSAKMMETILEKQVHALQRFINEPDNFTIANSEGLREEIAATRKLLTDYSEVVRSLERALALAVSESRNVAHLRH